MKYDIAVIGGGIVGAATFYKLQKKFPNLSIVLFEKEAVLADHQTGNNSGVIHSGLYYKPGSLKARNCIQGRKELVQFAKEYNIAHDVCGKVVVATDQSELPNMDKIFNTGLENGIEGIEKITADQVRDIEPHVKSIGGIWVPVTGIIDFRGATEKMAELALAANPQSAMHLGCEVQGIDKGTDASTIFTSKGTFEASYLVFCAGLQADRLARKDGVALKEQVVGFRGDYYELTPEAKHKVKNLIYPVPDPAFPFLGVHFTRMTDGTTECGPNAVFAFEREGYQRHSFSIKDTTEAFAFGGTWKMFAQHWQMGLHEQQRAWSKPLFLKALQKLIPDLKSEDIVRSRSGVRAMTLRKSGEMVDDFEFAQHGNNLHVLNAPSPAATACLAIADTIVDKLNGKGYKSDRL